PPATLQVGTQTFEVLANGSFGGNLTLPDGAAQTLVVTAVDLAGNESRQTRTFTIADTAGDTTPPSIVVLSPAYDATVPTATFTVVALVTDESPLTAVTLAGTAVATPGADG